MRITALDVTRVPVNRRGGWLFVHLRTDEGLGGLGEASHGGGGPDRDGAVERVLQTHCLPMLEALDPLAVRACAAALQPLATDSAAATAVSACEQALWDLAGKAAGLPLYRLLGGPARRRIPLYANINRATDDRTPAGFARNAMVAVADGFTAIKLAPFDGMQRERLDEPEQRQRLALGIDCVAAVRNAVGPSIEVFVDCHSRFDQRRALAVASELRRLGVTWFEEPLPTEDLEGLAALRPLLSDLELIGGERLFGLAGFWPYLARGVWDAVMPDVKHCGGIGAALAIGEAAAAAGVAVAPHNPSGPVAMAASAHVAAALPFFRILEYAWGEVPWRASLVKPAERIEGGSLVLPEGPGIGVVVERSERLAAAADADVPLGHH